MITRRFNVLLPSKYSSYRNHPIGIRSIRELTHPRVA